MPGGITVSIPVAIGAKSGLSPAAKMDGRQWNVAAIMAVVPLALDQEEEQAYAPWERHKPELCQKVKLTFAFQFGPPPA